MMKKLFFAITLALAACSSPVHLQVSNPKKAGKYPAASRQLKLLAEKTPYRDCYDVYHDGLKITIDPSKRYLKGEVVISARVLHSSDTIQFDLYKNLKINSVMLNGVPAEYTRVEGAVFITHAGLQKDAKFAITVSYEGSPVVANKPPWDGGFVWKKDKTGKPWIGVACETEGASLWWPCKDEMADEADSTDEVYTVPQGLMAVGNGYLADSSQCPGWSTFHWHVSYPVNKYDVTVYVGNLKLLHDEYHSPVSGKTTALNHYVLPVNYEKAKTHFQQLKGILEFYENKFGEYPWQRDGFKFVESPYEGMEHQTAIAYGNGYKNDYEFFDYIILHETAHEWWGNSVTAADLGDGWIHEGFASYCEALFVESRKGHDAYLNYMHFQRIFIKNERPVARKRNIRYFDYHDEDIYNKGSWVLHTLRNTLGNDSLFFDILKTFRVRNNCKQVYSEDFVNLVNEKTGSDYNWFFKQYLFKREAPILEYFWYGDQFYFRWTATEADFKMPVELYGEEGRIRLEATTKLQKISVAGLKKFYFNNNELYYGTKLNKKLPELYE